MIIWRKWGILVPILVFAVLIATQFAVDAVAGDGTYSGSSPLFPGIGLILGGAVTYAFAEWEARRNPPRVLIEKDTGKEITQTDRSDLFFIPIRYWGMLLVVVGIGAVIVGLFD